VYSFCVAGMQGQRLVLFGHIFTFFWLMEMLVIECAIIALLSTSVSRNNEMWIVILKLM